MRSDPDKTKVLFLIFDSARGGAGRPGTARPGRAGHPPTNFQYFGPAPEESSSSRPHTASHARTHARTHALHRDRNRNRFPGWTHPPASNFAFVAFASTAPNTASPGRANGVERLRRIRMQLWFPLHTFRSCSHTLKIGVEFLTSVLRSCAGHVVRL